MKDEQSKAVSKLREWIDLNAWIVTWVVMIPLGFGFVMLLFTSPPRPASSREEAQQIIDLVLDARLRELDDLSPQQEQRLMQLETQRWTVEQCKTVETAQLQSLWAEINYLRARANHVDKHMSGCGCWPREEP